MLEKLVLYLTGTIHQGTGDLLQALAYYENLLNDPSEIGLLATINTAIIFRGSDHRDDRRADFLLQTVERACSETKNALVKAAFCCVRGTERGELIKSKYVNPEANEMISDKPWIIGNFSLRGCKWHSSCSISRSCLWS